MKFNFNNDLKSIMWKNLHNWFHFCVCLLGGFLGFGILVWFIGLTWEIGDGFKRHYTLTTSKDNWFTRNFLISDGFSLSDVIVFNTAGTVIGTIINNII